MGLLRWAEQGGGGRYERTLTSSSAAAWRGQWTPAESLSGPPNHGAKTYDWLEGVPWCDLQYFYFPPLTRTE